MTNKCIDRYKIDRYSDKQIDKKKLIEKEWVCDIVCVKYNLVGCKKPILLSSQNTTIANPQFYSAWPLEARILLGQK